MNSNNKLGKCPAFMHDSRIFTNWETSKTYNYKLAKKFNVDNNTKYKEYLITNPESAITNFNIKELQCQNNETLYDHSYFVNNIMNDIYKVQTVKPFFSYEYYNY